MARVLAAWVGDADLAAAATNNVKHPGPISSALEALPFDELLLLTNRDVSSVYELKNGQKVRVDEYLTWLGERHPIKVEHRYEPLKTPVHFGEIYEAARRNIEQVRLRHPKVQLTFHTSPGTPAMGAVWILLARTVFKADLIQSSIEAGVEPVDFPFEISAEFIPDLMRRHDEELARRSVGAPPEAPEFKAIIGESKELRQAVALARRVALRSVPVLIEGESGTGKELFARAIHKASLRKGEFIPVNCGAIPKELMESEFFGHKEGAFTGAKADRQGHFAKANGGTLFLDEVGEMPLDLQVKLLRVLEEQAFTPVGASGEVKVDVRIVAATNRSLLHEVEAKKFREDLFYRLAVAVLTIPSLRDRKEDIPVLAEALIKRVNEESSKEPGYEPKRLDRKAKQRLEEHSWPGNVRELLNTLRRAAVWSEGKAIGIAEIDRAIMKAPARGGETILHRAIGEGFKLQDVLDEVEEHYLERAMKETGRIKSRASKLLGFTNEVTFASRLKKHKKA